MRRALAGGMQAGRPTPLPLLCAGEDPTLLLSVSLSVCWALILTNNVKASGESFKLNAAPRLTQPPSAESEHS